MSSIPPGSHWITVHHGDGNGQPILIQPQPDGSAKVIGGAGGALNHLRLRGVKSKEQYKKEAAEKQKDRQKQKRERESDAGGEKKQKKTAVDFQKREAEQKIIQEVGKRAGWSAKDMQLDESKYSDLSDKALGKLRNKHHNELLRRAKDVIKQGRERLLTDAMVRKDLGIGEIPLESNDPDVVSVQDLDPVTSKKSGLGFAADYSARAEAKGLSENELKEESRAIKLAGLTEEQRAKAFEIGKGATLISEELKGIAVPPAPNADASLLSAQDALELAKAGKQLALIEKAARAAKSAIDDSIEAKAFVLEVSPSAVDDAVSRDLENDLKTVSTVSFLDEVHKIAGGSPEETLGGHISAGAFNAVNSLSLAVSGSGMIDRSVVDVLGIAGAAQVLARRLHKDLNKDEVGKVSAGMADYHANHFVKISDEAIKKARALTDAAEAIKLPDTVETADDIEMAQELNARRRSAVGDAQRLLGHAMGQMEANAAMVMALKQGGADSVEVSLGKTTPEQAIKQVRALGLHRRDYTIEKAAGNLFLTVHGSGMDKLADPINREDLKQIQRNIGIMRGDQDQDGWLPLGVADRPDLAPEAIAAPGVAERFAVPWQPQSGADLKSELKRYVGARAADGDSAADILADVQSSDFFNKSGDPAGYRAALDAVVPTRTGAVEIQRAEDLQPMFEQYADEHIANLGGERTTVNRQQIKMNQASVEALHRALSETPEGTAAYKPIGDLDGNDQRAIRSFFSKNIAKDSPELADLKKQLGDHVKKEPAKTVQDMFGEDAPNPEYSDWKDEHDRLTSKIDSSSLDWPKYISSMGGREKAYQAVQDLIRSRVSESFAKAHNTLNPDSPIKVGRQVIRNNLNHLDTVDPASRAKRQAEKRQMLDSLRERAGGKYASGSVTDKIDAERAKREAYAQSQMGFFSTEEEPEDINKPLASDERHTIGHAAEMQLAGMMGVVGRNFKPGQPTKLWHVSMSGKYAPQQRAIKLVEANKRMVLAAGAGSGKTNMMLGTHAHLASQGKIKRSLMLVPSIVQGQFLGESLRLLEPGKFKTHIHPGASQAERIRAYKDPDTHIAVMTHQSFRDDMVHLAARQDGISKQAMVAKIAAMSPLERKAWAAKVMEKEGIQFDASFVDEAHDTLNRAGKEDSSLSNVVESVGHNTPYHVYASGDPVKNDVSEIHSMLHKMDPVRYADRAAFIRKYGVDTMASKAAPKNELARYMYATSITPDVTADRTEVPVELSAGQKKAMQELSANVAKVRQARKAGKIDVAAARAISPASFEGVSPDQHESIADGIHKSLGAIKATAENRIINMHPDNAKIAKAVEIVSQRPGKQGVIFARNRDAVEQYKQAMEKAGKRVVTITGSDTAKDKDAKRRLFNPEQGEAKADILIASDAGAVGMNLQSGQYLIQHDVSLTAKTHSQRNARIHRIGQKNDIELMDLVANHKSERVARKRLKDKYGLKDMMADPIDGLDDSGVAAAIKMRFK